MHAGAGRDLLDAAILVLETLAYRLLRLLERFEVDADLGKDACILCSDALKHLVVVCVSKHKALHPLQELSFVVFEQGCSASTTG